jgi:hypothetical protein
MDFTLRWAADNSALGNVLREDLVANISLSAAPGDVESATLRVKVGVAAA